MLQTDRQTDIRGKNNMSPPLSGGDIIHKVGSLDAGFQKVPLVQNF